MVTDLIIAGPKGLRHHTAFGPAVKTRSRFEKMGLRWLSQPVSQQGNRMEENPEQQRLAAHASRLANWKQWGPYLSNRAWGTVREDYSADGNAWDHFPHDHARSRAYRWGEDGLAGICDRHQYLCFAVSLYNGVDPISKSGCSA